MNFYDGPDESAVITPRYNGFECVPLILASDLEQVTRERDEAVRLLREAVADLLGDDWRARSQAFLASLRSMEKTCG